MNAGVYTKPIPAERAVHNMGDSSPFRG